MSSHCIRVNPETKEITKAFSTAFEKPLMSDIEISQNANRHFDVNGTFPKGLIDEYGLYNYRWNPDYEQIEEIPVSEKQTVIDEKKEQADIEKMINEKIRESAIATLILGGKIEEKDGKLKIKK